MQSEFTQRDHLRLAERLLRRRSRVRASRIVRERFPEVARIVDASWESGRAMFPVTMEVYGNSVWHVIGRVWRRSLQGRSDDSLLDVVVGLDRGTFLRDLAAWSAGLEDPESGATSFYLAFPEFGERVDGWFQRAAEESDLGSVCPHRFRRKCFGVAVYYLLNPLRAAASGAPRVVRGFEDDPSELLDPIEANGWYRDLYFAVALGSANQAAVDQFPELYGGQVRAILTRRGVPRGELDDLAADLLSECILTACNYFASGTFWGWLVYQSYSFLRRWAPRPGSDMYVPQLHSDAERNHASEAVHVAQRAWNRLSDAERSMLSAYWAERQTLQQMADRLDVHETTALRQRDRAERQCRMLMREEARRVLGDDASEEECLEFLLEYSRHLDFGFEATGDASSEAEKDDSPSEYCPMVPHRLP